MQKLRHAAQQAKARKALDQKRKAEAGPSQPEGRTPTKAAANRERSRKSVRRAGSCRQLAAMQRAKFARQ